MTQKSHTKFEENLTCGLEDNMHELKTYRGVVCNDTEE